jgi:pilus assembly protein CpaD
VQDQENGMNIGRSTKALRGRSIWMALLLCSTAALGACTHTQEEITASIPDDYRLRHPIVVQEADHTIEVFVGSGRGGLTASQRADVMAFARSWSHEATGGIIIDVPDGTANARAAADSLHEIQSMFASMGIPPHAVTTRPYRPRDPAKLATLKLNYPKMTADAGPCGEWPDDLGPRGKDYLNNRSYWNLGCAYQRNMAAMVDNPADLVQPRPETPSYTARRTVVFDKYRKGEPTASINADASKGQISDLK